MFGQFLLYVCDSQMIQIPLTYVDDRIREIKKENYRFVQLNYYSQNIRLTKSLYREFILE